MWYLSGPMTGHPQLNFPLFDAVAQAFRAHGVAIMSPHELCLPHMSWAFAMAVDLSALRRACGVILLPGWRQSSGARLEWAWARAGGLPRLPLHVAWQMLVLGSGPQTLDAGLLVPALS